MTLDIIIGWSVALGGPTGIVTLAFAVRAMVRK